MKNTQFVLTDAVIYVGNNNTLGLAKKVTTPKIKPVLIKRKFLGGIGEQTLPNGKVEVDDLQITLNAFYEHIFKSIANPFEAVSLRICGNLMGFENGSAVENKPAELYLRGRSSEFATLGELNEHDDVDYEMNFACSKIRLVVGEKELLNLDIDNNQYIVNGVDVRKNIVKNLGLT